MVRRKPKQQQQQQQQQPGMMTAQPSLQPQQPRPDEMMMQTIRTNVSNFDINETKKWHTIYPQYINSNLTVERGRRLSRQKCVNDPLAEEIFDVLVANSTQFQVLINLYKCYGRELDKENLRTRGYIKYNVIGNDERLKTKKQILQYVASMIPKLKSRQQKFQQQQKQSGGGQQNVEQQQQQSQQQQQQGGKKKNRRK